MKSSAHIRAAKEAAQEAYARHAQNRCAELVIEDEDTDKNEMQINRRLSNLNEK